MEVHSNRHDLSPILMCGQELRGSKVSRRLSGKSRAEFGAKIGLVLEEADETAFWLELLIESNLMKHPDVSRLQRKATEVRRIMYASCTKVPERKF